MLNYDKINHNMDLYAIKKFSREAGSIHLKLNNVIHVAGTNGKGSTVAFLRSLLEVKGCSVNTFTSPHLVKTNERIRIKGKLISDKYQDELTEKLLKYKTSSDLSIFETFMAKALIAFTENIADYIILETGLGGRLDATNIFNKPLISVITTVDYDHEHILGNTLSLIAKEKAGIIKHKSICVSAYQEDEVSLVLREECLKNKTTLIEGGKDWYLKEDKVFYKNICYSLQDVSLRGLHQKYNAALAIVSLLSCNIIPNQDIINKGLKRVYWPGRLQQIDSNLYGIKLNKEDKIVLDGAHNPSGIKVLSDYISYYSNKYDVYMIMGMLKTKQLDMCLSILSNIPIKTFFSVDLPKEFDSFSKEYINKIAKENNIKTEENFINIKDIMTYLSKINNQRPKLIIIFGSLYLIGNIMKDNNIYPI